ncbi:MAG TPA: PfkB family carbohydrate kinase [bacterium]|nr:PfkB family carbohydrate kinase [bacterium]
MPARPFDLITLGLNAVDRIALLDRPYRPDDKLPVRAIVRRAGGQAATAAVTAARLGRRAAFIGAVGDDDDGRWALAELRRERVDVRGVVVRRRTTSQQALILAAPDGSRTIFWHKSSGITVRPHELDRARLARARCFLCDGHFPAAELAAARHCRRHGVPTVIDLEHDAGPTTRRLLRQIDHIVCPGRMPDRLRGVPFANDRARCAWLRATFAATAVVLTLGARGCCGLDARGFHRVPARRVRVVDTTGAGDVFHGAYCVALLAGQPLAQRLVFANYVAGEKCRQAGARAGIPRLRDLPARLRPA